MDNAKLYDESKRHCRIFFDENNGWVDDKKALLHAKRWDVYVNKKGKNIKGGYSV